MSTRIELGDGDVVTIPDIWHEKDCDCSPYKGAKIERRCRRLTRKMHRIFSNPLNADSLRLYFRKKGGRLQ